MDDDEARFSVTRTGEEGDRVVLAVTGEVDTYTSARLRDALTEAVESGATDVVLDVSEMEFIDSTGLGVLVGALKKLQERDGKLTLRKPRPTALEVLTIVGLTSHFGIEEG
jgi:anti-sigma B factor antagonist